jgi:hypothetical protein
MKKITLLLLVSFIHFFTFCQKDEKYNYEEKINLHLNAYTFITGEKLLYNIYCINDRNMISNLSKVAYVKCIDNKGNEIFTNKHYLNNGNDSGSYFISQNLKTGTYKIIVYTRWMLNFGISNYFEKEITIINPYSKKEKDSIFFEKDSINYKLDDIIIEKTYNKRESVVWENSKKEMNGNFSVSIRRIDKIVSENQSIKNQKQNTLIKNQTLILPEVKGEIISGKIVSNNQQNSLKNIGIGLTDNGNKDYLNITTSNNKGEFYFILPTPLNSSNIYIEPIGNDSNYSIILDPQISPIIESYKTESIKLKENYTDEIKTRAIAAQIENAYYEIKKDSLGKEIKTKTINEDIFKIFDLENIIRFATIKEFIVEVLNQVYYTEKDSQFKLFFRNNETAINEVPLIILDGKIINKHSDLLNFDFKKATKIATYNLPYYFGNKLYEGVFIVTTTIDDTQKTSNQSTKLDYLKPSIERYLYTPDYSIGNNLNKIPDYRIQLLWKPNLSSLIDPIKFYTSDVEGDYEIQIIGYTNEGLYINEKRFFKIN